LGIHTQSMIKMETKIQIGKNGVTPQVIEEIRKQLRKNGKVRVKMLGSFVHGKDKKALANEIAAKSGARFSKMVGFVFLLEKRK